MREMKVDVDLTEDDNGFEKDLDAEMMMMIAQTEEENFIPSCSKSTADKWRRQLGNVDCNVLSTDSTFMSSCATSAADSRQRVLETSSGTASDPGVSHCSASRNIAACRPTSPGSKLGFSDRNEKHFVEDAHIKGVKYCSVARNDSAGNETSYNSSSLTPPTYSALPGSVEIVSSVLKFSCLQFS